MPVVTEMFSKALQLWRDEDGVSTVECALLLAVLAVAAMAAYDKIGSLMSDGVTQATDDMSAARADLWRQAASAGQLR